MRWYLRYPLSYRDLEEMVAGRGLSVDHSTIARWVLHYLVRVVAPALPVKIHGRVARIVRRRVVLAVFTSKALQVSGRPSGSRQRRRRAYGELKSKEALATAKRPCAEDNAAADARVIAPLRGSDFRICKNQSAAAEQGVEAGNAGGHAEDVAEQVVGIFAFWAEPDAGARMKLEEVEDKAGVEQRL